MEYDAPYEEDANAPSVIDDAELANRETHDALLTLEDAVWSVSSAKHGNGVTCLLDNSHHTFWQSDGFLPHVISIDFPSLTSVRAVAIYLDFQQDESYTPRRIRVQAGTHRADVSDVAGVVVVDPLGWVMIPLKADDAEEAEAANTSRTTTACLDRDDHAEFVEEGVWCTQIRVILEENRQNGRDCHVRGVKVLGPAQQSVFTAPSFTEHLVLR